MRKEVVAIVGTNGLPAKYGGFETLTNYLTIHLSNKYKFHVYCSLTDKNKRLKEYNNSKLIYLPFRANGYQSVIYDVFSIVHAWFTADKLLILGNSGALIFPFKVLFNKKLVLNIGGIDWGRSKWGYLTKKFIQLSEVLCVRYSDIVITDNEYIQEQYVERYKVQSVLIEYGGDHANRKKITKKDISKYPFLCGEYCLSVSRAQSDNNIHMVLEAFEETKNKNIVLISNWDSSEYGKALKVKYKDRYSNIIIIDAIYDQTELDVLRSNAKLYIHSHSFCGTAPSLVEAMCLGLPVICYNAQTNIRTTEGKSLYFDDQIQLINIMNDIDDKILKDLSVNLKEIADRRYAWEIISQKYDECLK